MTKKNNFGYIGDFVRIIDPFSKYCGKIGKIIGISSLGTRLKIENDVIDIYSEYTQKINLPYNCILEKKGPIAPKWYINKIKRKNETEKIIENITKKRENEIKKKIFHKKQENVIKKFQPKINKTIKIINPKNKYFGKYGTIIKEDKSGFVLLKIDEKNVKVLQSDFIREDKPVYFKKKTENDIKKIFKNLEKLEKLEELEELEKKDTNLLKISEHIENEHRKFSKLFLINLEVQINSVYEKKGTMFYPYEKVEFYKLINKNKKYLNVRQGNLKESIVSIILKSNNIAIKDKKGNDRENIKLELIDILSKAGTNLNISDINEQTPLDIAKKLRYTKIENYLNDNIIREHFIKMNI